MSDLATLLKAARNLDKNALGTIFDTYSPSLYKFISRLIHDPLLSDHMVADVFVRLLEELGAGRGPRANLRSYLYQIAYRPHSPLEVAIRTAQKDTAEDAQTGSNELAMMEALLSNMNTELSEDQRIVIILRFLEDFSLKETAEIIGKDVNNVKVIQTRGIAKLKQARGLPVESE